MGISAVLIDSREPSAVQKLKFGGAPTVIAELDAGDFHVACDDGHLLAIERKSPSDFLNTLRDERLFPQMVKLRETTAWAYLVITGGLYPGANDKVWFDDGSAIGQRETGWAWQAVQGALLSCQEVGVHVIFTNGLLDLEATVIRLANRDRSALRVAPARDTAFLSDYETILSALPQVGPERAKALLEACVTPAWALDFLTDLTSPHKVPGVGQGLKRLIRHELGLEDNHTLSVLSHEAATATVAKQETAEEMADRLYEAGALTGVAA